MSKRVVGVAKGTGEEVPIGSEKVILTSTDVAAPWHQLHLEHVVFDDLDKPEMTIADPYVGLILGEPLVHWKAGGTWRHHTFRSGQLSIKGSGDLGQFQSADGCEVVLVSIDTGLLTDIAAQMGLPPNVEIVDDITADNEFLRALVLAIRAEVASAFPGGRMLYESLQTALCSYLLTRYSTLDGGKTAAGLPGLNNNVLKRIDDYVLENFTRDISLTELARVAYMSNYHFSRMFKRSTGFSPYNYLCNLRVRQAAALMKAGADDIVRVGYSVGFRDRRAFDRHFKRIMGESPAAYLKHIR